MSDPIFQKGLQDLIKGIRSHKKDPSAFISQAMASIKIELRSTDPFLKTEAVRNMTPFVRLLRSTERMLCNFLTWHLIIVLDPEADIFANDRIQRKLGSILNRGGYVADEIRAQEGRISRSESGI